MGVIDSSGGGASIEAGVEEVVNRVFDRWISGSEIRNRSGASINEAALPRIRDEVLGELAAYFCDLKSYYRGRGSSS
ncbi:MAG: hypothetical protein AAB930_00510 [Patescibacteria group bacterium]|mgnify:FL=1